MNSGFVESLSQILTIHSEENTKRILTRIKKLVLSKFVIIVIFIVSIITITMMIISKIVIVIGSIAN